MKWSMVIYTGAALTPAQNLELLTNKAVFVFQQTATRNIMTATKCHYNGESKSAFTS